MENSYGIGITNRYDLFYLDDDEQDPFEQLKQKKAKAPVTAAPVPAKTEGKKPTAQVITQLGDKAANKGNTNNKNAEKENNKSASNKNNAGGDKATGGNKAPNAGGQGQGERRQGGQGGPKRDGGIRDNQNVKEGGNRGPRDDKDKNSNRNIERSKEERNNRRNRPEGDRAQNGQIGEFNNREDRPPRRQGGGGGQGGNGEGGQRRFERRGKREFDRQSGSDKTGVKAVEKRDGAGAHNWGSHKQDLEDFNKSGGAGGEYLTDGEKNDSNAEENAKDETTGEPAEPTPEEPKEMTLDEWKAQRAAARAKPKYNLRKAGEGEDTGKFKDMVALKKKDDDESDLDPSNNQKTAAETKKKQILDIDFHFADSRRTGGGLGRPRGRGNRQQGGEGGNRGGERGERRGDGENRENRGGERENRGGDRENRRPQRPIRGDRDHGNNERRGPAAPKVDDEHDFPSLG